MSKNKKLGSNESKKDRKRITPAIVANLHNAMSNPHPKDRMSLDECVTYLTDQYDVTEAEARQRLEKPSSKHQS